MSTLIAVASSCISCVFNGKKRFAWRLNDSPAHQLSDDSVRRRAIDLQRPKKLRLSFSSVGVQAKGRTTILKLNYCNTAEILAVIRAAADDLFPIMHRMTAGRRGLNLLLINLSGYQLIISCC